MKKVLAAALILMAAGTLFAEVTVGGAVDMAIVPFQFILNEDANETRTPFSPEQEEVIFGPGAGRVNSSQGPRARLDLRASYEDVIGMRARIQARTDGIGIEDYLQAWWKPLNWLRIDGGRFFDDRLRGKINDLDERMNAYNVRMYDGDAIFTRFRTHRNGGEAGLLVSAVFDAKIIGNDELFVGAMMYDLLRLSNTGGPGTLFDAHPDYVANNADAFQNIQAAFGWTVKDLFLFRVQYVGAKPQVAITRQTDGTATILSTYDFNTYSITAPRIEAAFALTSPGLIVDIGGKVPLPFKDWTRPVANIFEKEDEGLITDSLYLLYKNNYIWQDSYQVSFGINSTFGDFGIGGRVDTKFGGSVKGTKTEMYFAPELNIHIWPSYNLGFATVIADFGFEYIGATLNEDGKIVQDGNPRPMNGGNRIGAGISLEKKIVNNCLIKGGVAWKNSGKVNGVQEKMVISVPLFVDWTF
ncbi:MAG: hypothetical protein LBG91_05080 [Treponema sp.]|jgi:hypothetical protein|nr:hypothetical protein [Treponema sp.]